MIKEYLIENGNNLLFWMKDVLSVENTKDVCTSARCADVLAKVIQNNSFECISEEEGQLLCKDFLDPVTFKDIDIVAKDSFYIEVFNESGKLWTSAPSKIRNAVYGNL